MSQGQSFQEFPSAAPYGAVDEDSIYAYELAVKLHEGRYRIIPRFVTVQPPAAGAEWSQAVPQGSTWIVLAISALLTTSAVVQTRAVGLLLGDGTTTVLRLPAAGTVAASQTARISWSRQLGATITPSASGGLAAPFPNIPLFGGLVLSTNTLNLDAGDTWTQIALYVLEVTETTLSERAELLRNLVTGAHAELYPGLLKGL